MKRQALFLSIVWLIILSASFMYQYYDSEQTRKELILGTTRVLFDQILITRQWNSEHGGVYVPVTKETPPNPYLDDPNRDIKVSKDLTLTKINPAYMTRQIAELVTKMGNMRIHVTSLKPIRPDNSPNPREQKALKSFEDGATEVGQFIKDADKTRFFYMAPLKVEKACLKCHEKQGYKEGDIRGGISIITPVREMDHLTVMIAGHLIIGLFGLLGITLFMMKLNKSYEVIQKQAVVDALTDIPNRRAFMERIESEFRRSAREKSPLSVLMIDIDHFKLYNDTYGHADGDECLKTVAQEIKNTVKRPGDFCARYGGEEFVVLLPDTSLEAARLLAENIRANIQDMKLSHIESPPLNVVTVSLGIASATGSPTTTYETILQQSDKALYSAKNRGRNRVEVFVG
ncbi:MAG: diguanylate cyclase [Nitrospirota bacterium]